MSQLVNKGNDFAKLSEKHPPASLYVGELAPTVTEAVLYEHFKNAGTIASIRICRFNQKSNGYAYVNFLDAKDAERALEILNHSDIQGKPCRIMWQIRDPSHRKCNLFIKNLPLEVSPKDLSDAFSRFGDILSTKIAKDEKGLSKGFGFVHFAVPTSANAAMDAFIKGDIHFRSAPQPAPQSPPLVMKQFIPKQVVVKNLNSSVTDQQLNELFSVFGKITAAVVMKNEDGSSRGFGFVNFDTHENAERAVQQMHEKEFEGRKLWCGPAQKKSERWTELEKLRKLSKGTNLYLKNFDDDLTEEKLRQYFTKEAYGEITSLKIMTDDKGLSRGFGFISFGTSQGTAIALNEMNGRPLPGSRKPLYVAYHEPLAIKRKKLQTRFANRTYAKSRPPAPMPMYPYYSQYPVYPQTNPRRPNPWPAPHAPYPVPQMQPYQPQPPMKSRPKPTPPPIPTQDHLVRPTEGNILASEDDFCEDDSCEDDFSQTTISTLKSGVHRDIPFDEGPSPGRLIKSLLTLGPSEQLPSLNESLKQCFPDTFQIILDHKIQMETKYHNLEDHHKRILSQEDFAAIYYYCIEDPPIYMDLNLALVDQNRVEKISKWKYYLHYLLNALKKLPPIQPGQVLWRGVTGDLPTAYPKIWAENKRKIIYSFCSSSTTKDKVLQFALKKGDGTLMEIENAHYGRDISSISPYSEEEILFPPGVCFHIVSIKKEQNSSITCVKLRQMENSENLLG